MKRLVWYTVVVLLTLLVLMLLYQFRVAVVLFLLSLAVAATFRPAIERLIQRGMSRVLAILLTYLVGVGIVVLLIILAGPQLIKNIQQATDDFANFYTQFRLEGAKGSGLEKTIASQLPPLETLYKGITGQQGLTLANTLLGVTSTVFDNISRLAIVLVLSIYWSIDSIHFERLWLSLLPARRRIRARDVWRSIEKGVGSYIRSELIQSLLAALLLWAAYNLLGIKYATLLAVIGAIAWLIPWLGVVLAIVPPLLAGLSVNLFTGLAAAGITLVILIILETLVEPRFFNRRRYSSLLVVLVMIAMAESYGLVGILVSPPLAAAIQILLGYLFAPPIEQPVGDPLVEIQALRVRLDHVRQMEANANGDAPQIDNLSERLKGLIDRTEETLRAD